MIEIDEVAFGKAAQTDERFVCLDGTTARRTAADAEVEAMAEKLWDVFQSIVQADGPVPWSVVTAYGTHLGPEWEDKALTVFRALARVALGENGDEVRG